MANDYATAAELKQLMPDTTWTGDYDALLDGLITRASRSIDRFTKREPGAYASDTDTTRYFDGSGTGELWIDEMAAAPTTVQVAEGGDLATLTTYGSTDWFMWPYNALLEGRPYQAIYLDVINGSKVLWAKYPRSVKIVGKFGYSTAAPDEVKQATLILAVRMFKRGAQGFQDIGAVTDLGQLRYVNAVDPDVAHLIEHLRRVTI